MLLQLSLSLKIFANMFTKDPKFPTTINMVICHKELNASKLSRLKYMAGEIRSNKWPPFVGPANYYWYTCFINGFFEGLFWCITVLTYLPL